MEALLVLLPRKRRTSLVIYRHGKLTCLPCVSPSDGPQILLVPVQLNSYRSLRIATVTRHIHNTRCCNVDHHVMHTLHHNRMDHNARIEAVVTDLESQDCVNYKATAKKWNLDRTTLVRRYRGETVLNQEATLYAR